MQRQGHVGEGPVVTASHAFRCRIVLWNYSAAYSGPSGYTVDRVATGGSKLPGVRSGGGGGTTVPVAPPTGPTKDGGMGTEIELTPQEHALLLEIAAFFSRYPERLRAAASRLELQINETGVRHFLTAQAEADAAMWEKDAEWMPDSAQEFRSRAARVREGARAQVYDPLRHPYWRFASIAVITLCRDAHPAGRMTEGEACDVLFLLWAPWDPVNLSEFGCPSGAIVRTAEGWGRRYVFEEVLEDRWGRPGHCRNAHGLLPPFERARRALAELQARPGTLASPEIRAPGEERPAPKPTRLSPATRKAGESLQAAINADDSLAPEAGKSPSRRAWEWAIENEYDSKGPDYETWKRYVRAYYADGRPGPLRGKNVSSRSIVYAKDLDGRRA